MQWGIEIVDDDELDGLERVLQAIDAQRQAAVLADCTNTGALDTVGTSARERRLASCTVTDGPVKSPTAHPSHAPCLLSHASGEGMPAAGAPLLQPQQQQQQQQQQQHGVQPFHHTAWNTVSIDASRAHTLQPPMSLGPVTAVPDAAQQHLGAFSTSVQVLPHPTAMQALGAGLDASTASMGRHPTRTAQHPPPLPSAPARTGTRVLPASLRTNPAAGSAAEQSAGTTGRMPNPAIPQHDTPRTATSCPTDTAVTEDAAAAAITGQQAGAQPTPRQPPGQGPTSCVLPTLQLPCKPRYASTPIEVEWLVKQALAAQPDVIGLDIEWRPSFVMGASQPKTATIQIAYRRGGGSAAAAAQMADACTGSSCDPSFCGAGVRSGTFPVSHTGAFSSCTSATGNSHCTTTPLPSAHAQHSWTCLVLQVAGSQQLPACLVQLLESEVPAKVGVNISGDASKLIGDYGIARLGGCVELSDLANSRVLVHRALVTTDVTTKRWSLAGLVEVALRAVLPKPKWVRCGNWERRPLTNEQVMYAALDAFAGLAVHDVLLTLPLRSQLLPAPTLATPTPEHGTLSPLHDEAPGVQQPVQQPVQEQTVQLLVNQQVQQQVQPPR